MKVVVDRHGDALYFSRSPIPFRRDGRPAGAGTRFKHIGLYGYRRDFLLDVRRARRRRRSSGRNRSSSLRALEHGYRIRVETPYDSIEVDTPRILNACAS